MTYRIAHSGDFHLDEDHYFGDTAQCVEWFIHDAIAQNVDLFVLDGDLTTYKETIKERNFWIDRLISMAEHAPVIVIAGNHGKELEGDFVSPGSRPGPARHLPFHRTGADRIGLGRRGNIPLSTQGRVGGLG